MGSAVQRLTGLASADDRFNIPFANLRTLQVEAMNERLQERRDSIKLVQFRADEAGLDEIRDHTEVAEVLLPHTAYKSYPENWLFSGKWDRMSRWLDTVATHRVPTTDAAQVRNLDGWLETLEASGHYLACSSGTTGKSAMLVGSPRDMQWVTQDNVHAFSWGSGIKPAQDRKFFRLGLATASARSRFDWQAMTKAYGLPDYEQYRSPGPMITVGGLMEMILLRKKIAAGTAKPNDLAEYEGISAERAGAIDLAVAATADALVAARKDKLHIAGMWANLHKLAVAVRERGYSGADFHPENSVYVGGGLKRVQLPDDYREYVHETFNIAPERTFQNYSMQELQTAMPRCREGGRYHVPPWLVCLPLNLEGTELLPLGEDEFEGRAGFFDLSLDGRWGGVISGDRIEITFGPCACGASSPSIRDNVTRYADIQGDDKIGCAGTIDAYVRGIS